jgi:hypothetical protein
MAELKVRWRGEVYELPTCLNEERAAVASAEWPDGIVDIATMFAPEHVSDFSEHQRRQLAQMVLQSLGESTIGLRVSPATIGKTETKPVPAGFGTIGKAVTSRPVELRKIDHASLEELSAAPGKGRGLQAGTAMRKLEAASSGAVVSIDGAGGEDASSSGGEGAGGEGASSSGGEGAGGEGASSSGGDGGTL